METATFERVYSSKTDDELLALMVERRSLEAEAREALWSELRRRKLTDASLLRRGLADETPYTERNPAFNVLARVAAILMLAGYAAFGLTLVFTARGKELLRLTLVSVLVWGPIFAAIGWATRRALRNRAHPPTKYPTRRNGR